MHEEPSIHKRIVNLNGKKRRNFVKQIPIDRVPEATVFYVNVSDWRGILNHRGEFGRDWESQEEGLSFLSSF
jgi:hypothetical protein